MRQTVVGFVTLLLLAGCGSESTASATAVPRADPTAETIGQAQPPVPANEPTAEPTAAPPAAPTADTSAATGDGLFPTVVDVSASTTDGTTWRVDVTLLSEYDSPARYADAWRVLDADDNELGIRVLAHDHAGEQPFTRSTSVDIPEGVTSVFVEGRDQLNGWSGERFELTLQR